MFTSCLLLSVYLLQASASPTPSLQRRELHVPLSHIHSSRYSDDPASQAAWARSAGERLVSKYRTPSPRALSKRLTSNISLVNANHDGSYSGLLGLGTPPTPLNVLLDTGSADFWVASTGCAAAQSGCGGLPLWDPRTSETYENASVRFEVGYGSGRASGVLGWDTVQLGAFEVVHQPVALCDHVSPGLLTSPVSGLMGLGFQQLSASGATPLWENLVQAGLWSAPLMTFFLTRFLNSSALGTQQPGGSFTMGYVDTSLYTGTIDYAPIPAGRAGYWLLELSSVAVRSSSIPLSASSSQNAAVIDTGTTLLLAPSSAIQAIFSLIPGSQPATGDYAGYYQYPCSSNTTLTLSFSGASRGWTISAADFQLLKLPNTQDTCIAALYESNLGNNAPQWVVGDTFLKNVYSVFRYDPPSVGFASLSSEARGLSAPGPLPNVSVLPPEATVTAPAEKLSRATRTPPSKGWDLGIVLACLILGHLTIALL
ncbi:acid protease [Calocera viscosa TUFC12733]|uniref:Acid protease n=1 Tax=Calocera viscosa (strain TUFC12733) TaxID=1330018 RepID=A0A167IPV5_CALVF|nr:acid protease [Calocera viscosa TUFC12733]